MRQIKNIQEAKKYLNKIVYKKVFGELKSLEQLTL